MADPLQEVHDALDVLIERLRREGSQELRRIPFELGFGPARQPVGEFDNCDSAEAVDIRRAARGPLIKEMAGMARPTLR